jgi:hypothetical protein
MNLNQTCSQCKHFLRYKLEENGQCYRNPPTVFANGTRLRPPVKTTDYACGEFGALPVGEPPAEKGKVQPATVGDAIRDTQQTKKGLPGKR